MHGVTNQTKTESTIREIVGGVGKLNGNYLLEVRRGFSGEISESILQLV